MEDLVYNLLLKSTQGLTLLGTLRFRFTDLDAANRGADLMAQLAQPLQRPSVELGVYQIEGEITVPLLTGLRPLALGGVGLGSDLAIITILIGSGDLSRILGLQFNYIDATHIGGGAIWQPTKPGQLIFSILGTQRALGM